MEGESSWFCPELTERRPRQGSSQFEASKRHGLKDENTRTGRVVYEEAWEEPWFSGQPCAPSSPHEAEKIPGSLAPESQALGLEDSCAVMLQEAQWHPIGAAREQQQPNPDPFPSAAGPESVAGSELTCPNMSIRRA